MNRKSKVIVSIVGITIVLLALLGITYAYYLTRIQGNTNTNSISITTADLKLEYGDGNEIITASNIVPNTTIAEKTFTVTNTGNTTIKNYRVILELASIEGVIPSVFKYPNDFEITMTCVSKNNTTNEESGTCYGYNGYWNNESFEMQKNTIDVGIRHEYSLTIKYVDSGIDQSDDMGKNLNLKVQIYGETDTSTLNGTITGVDSTYAMKLNSKPKVSILKPTNNTGEYRYSFIGVEPGEHTLILINKDGSVVSSETITINKGTNTSVNGSTITVKENQSTIHLTTSSSGNTLLSTATFNPYATNTLAYNIINNAKINKNGTQFVNTPPSKVAQENILENWNLGEEEILYYDDESVVMYAESKSDVEFCYYVDSDDCANYVSCTDDVKGKYVFDEATKETIYVLDCKNGKIVQDKKQYERVLVPTTDDYGTSYYFRGKVKDNYVNFANMCWRIVRIEGDGSVKLILEDRYAECNDTEDTDGTGTTDYAYTGNWSDGNYYAFGYDSNNGVDFLNYSGGLADSFKTFQTSKLTSTDLQKLKVDEWCYDDKATAINSYECDLDYDGENESQCTRVFYGAYTRIETNKKPSLNCTGTKLTKFRDNTDMYVGTLTADEMSFAGAYSTNYNYYLMNSYAKDNHLDLDWLSLSPFLFDRGIGGTGDIVVYFVDGVGGLTANTASRYSRPAVSLKSGSVITGGEGTLGNPYIIG